MKYFFCLICLIGCLSLYGQSNNELKPKDISSVWSLLKYDAKMTAHGIGHAYSRPFHWDSKDLQKLTTFAIGAFAISLVDEDVNDLFARNQDDVPRTVRDVGFGFGKPNNFFMINAGLYGFGLITKNESIRKTSVLIISSAITSGVIQSISKTAFGRARPESGLGYNSFNPFSSEAYEHSFPSGHTVLSVTMAHAIAKQFEDVWVKVGIYALGAITPITRLVENAHWLSDVTVGTILSIVVVDSIDKFLFQKDAYPNAKRNSKISWNLKLGSNQIGVVGTF